MPTFPSNPNNKPKNLGTPNPPITLRRDTGRTPGHRARRNPPRNPLRRAMRNPLRKGRRRATRNPGRDTGHTTRHHPEPTLTSSNTAPAASPKNTRGKRPGMGGRGGARSREGRDRGDGDTPVAPLLPLQPQKPDHGSQQIQHLIGIGHRPENQHPSPLKCQRPPTALFGCSLYRRHRHRLNPPHKPPTTTIRPRHALRTGNLQNPLKRLTSTKHLGYLH